MPPPPPPLPAPLFAARAREGPAGRLAGVLLPPPLPLEEPPLPPPAPPRPLGACPAAGAGAAGAAAAAAACPRLPRVRAFGLALGPAGAEAAAGPASLGAHSLLDVPPAGSTTGARPRTPACAAARGPAWHLGRPAAVHMGTRMGEGGQHGRGGSPRARMPAWRMAIMEGRGSGRGREGAGLRERARSVHWRSPAAASVLTRLSSSVSLSSSDPSLSGAPPCPCCTPPPAPLAAAPRASPGPGGSSSSEEAIARDLPWRMARRGRCQGQVRSACCGWKWWRAARAAPIICFMCPTPPHTHPVDPRCAELPGSAICRGLLSPRCTCRERVAVHASARG